MSIFDTLNKNIGALGMPGGLGLLTTGVGLLEGESPLKAVQAGLGTFGTLQDEEERRRRLGAIAKLGEQYAGDPRLKAIIDADPEAGLSLIAQLEAQKRRPRAPTLLSQRKQLADALGLEAGSDDYNRVLQTGSTAAPAITTAKDADGFLRNVATGERIFPDATGKVTPPKYREFDGDLYQETANGLSLVKKGTDEVKFTTLGDKVYRQDGTNLVEVIDDSTPPAPVLREVDGTLYNVTDPSNPVEVIKGVKDPKTANIGGALYDITDINNPKEIVAAKADPVNPNVKNYVADTDVTIGGKTYTAGIPFAVNQNDPDALGAVLEAGGRLAPTRTEQTVTNTNATDIKNTISQLEGETPDNSLNIDVSTAAGGDIGGVGTDLFNNVAALFGTTFDPSREEAKATVEAANNSIREPLVKALSRSGSVYTQKQISKLLPSSGDGNEAFIQKAEALIPTLRNELSIQAAAMNEATTATEKTAAENSARALVGYINSMESAIAQYRRRKNSNSSVTSRADAILSGGKP